jgi:hypothetical protein
MNQLMNCVALPKDPHQIDIRVICPKHLTAERTLKADHDSQHVASWNVQRNLGYWLPAVSMRTTRTFVIAPKMQTLLRNMYGKQLWPHYIRNAQLWTHEKNFGKDQVLHDVKFMRLTGRLQLRLPEPVISSPQNRHFGMLVRELEVPYLCRVIPPTKYWVCTSRVANPNYIRARPIYWLRHTN